jgi:hypothetical protein
MLSQIYNYTTMNQNMDPHCHNVGFNSLMQSHRTRDLHSIHCCHVPYKLILDSVSLTLLITLTILTIKLFFTTRLPKSRRRKIISRASKSTKHFRYPYHLNMSSPNAGGSVDGGKTSLSTITIKNFYGQQCSGGSQVNNTRFHFNTTSSKLDQDSQSGPLPPPLILPEANKEIAASDPVTPTTSAIRSGSSSPTSSEDLPTQIPSSSTAVEDLGPTQYQRRFRTGPALPEAFSWADDAIEDARRRAIGVGDINAYNPSSRTFMNGAAGWGFRAH